MVHGVQTTLSIDICGFTVLCASAAAAEESDDQDDAANDDEDDGRVQIGSTWKILKRKSLIVFWQRKVNLGTIS
jgi:hypothetical protein